MYRLVGRKSAEELIGRAVIEVFPELRDQGIIEILDEVYRTPEYPLTATNHLMQLDRTGSGEPRQTSFSTLSIRRSAMFRGKSKAYLF